MLYICLYLGVLGPRQTKALSGTIEDYWGSFRIIKASGTLTPFRFLVFGTQNASVWVLGPIEKAACFWVSGSGVEGIKLA